MCAIKTVGQPQRYKSGRGQPHSKTLRAFRESCVSPTGRGVRLPSAALARPRGVTGVFIAPVSDSRIDLTSAKVKDGNVPLSEKQRVYREMLHWTLPYLRNITTWSYWSRLRDRSAYYEAELVVYLVVSMFNPDVLDLEV